MCNLRITSTITLPLVSNAQGINGVSVAYKSTATVSLPISFSVFGTGVGNKNALDSAQNHGDDTGVAWVSTTQACFYSDNNACTMHGLFIGY